MWPADSPPIEAREFARATSRRRFGGTADHGYDHLRERTSHGFRPRPRTSREGVVPADELTPARAADQAYWAPALRDRLAAAGVRFLAP